jgi:beta-lactamase superfamily II metal-dependent hydrolase
MVKIKSFSVGNGDMFYINHMSDNFTIIDCMLPALDGIKKSEILEEVNAIKDTKGITRFISTHPDEDHIYGLKELDEKIDILNFYCVKNEATKEISTVDFRHYCTLRDHTDKAFYLYKGCTRRWMNQTNDERYGAGIHLQWPILDNHYFQTELENAKKGQTANNISPIITYTLNNGATFAWMGDLETDFMENIIDEIELPKVHVLFAPHHGRKSGTVPEWWLDQMNPDIIIVGEGPEEHMADYDGYNTITQNDAGNINFYLEMGVVDIFVENPAYGVGFLKDNYLDNDEDDEHYIGSIEVEIAN